MDGALLGAGSHNLSVVKWFSTRLVLGKRTCNGKWLWQPIEHVMENGCGSQL
jgi:hypothetical protein